MPLQKKVKSNSHNSRKYKNADFLSKGSYHGGVRDSKGWKTKFTHTSFIGGGWVIKGEQREDFYTQYADAWKKQEMNNPTLFITERYNDEVFRMFFDIDFKEFQESPSIESIHDDLRIAVHTIIKEICADIDLTFEMTDLKINVSARSAKKIHMIFPQLIVTEASALMIAQVVAHLMTLDDVPIDVNPYKDGSLRLLGSCKADGDSYYRPYFNGQLKEEITASDVRNHSIFPPENVLDEMETRQHPHTWEFNGVKYFSHLLQKEAPPTFAGVDTTLLKKQHCGSLPEKCKPYLGDIIGNGLEQGASIMYDAETKCIIINIRTTKCPLANREHTQNHPYFVLNKHGMRVKCHSTTTAACKEGGDVVSFETLPPEIRELLPLSALQDDDTVRIFPDIKLNHLFIESVLDGTNYSLARFYAIWLSGKYVVISKKDNTPKWYAFKNHRWRADDAIDHLNNDMDTSVTYIKKMESHLTKRIRYYKKQIKEMDVEKENDNEVDSDDEEEADVDEDEDLNDIRRLKHKLGYVEGCRKTCQKVWRALETKPFRNNVIGAMVHKTRISLEQKTSRLSFLERLDLLNKHLICFENGVYDLEKHEFRDGRPEDYMSLSVGYDYKSMDELDIKIVEHIDLIRSQIQPDADTQIYTWKALSSMLHGDIPDQKIHFFIGNLGNEGKSTLTTMVSHALGDYCTTLKSNMFVQVAAPSDNATPGLNKTVGRRGVFVEEIGKGAIMTETVIKTLTLEKIEIRKLNEESRIIEVQMKLFILTNNRVKLIASDGGTLRRLEHVEFTSQFVPEPNVDIPNEFLLDKKITKLFRREDYKIAIFHTLLQFYRIYEQTGLDPIPKSVLKFRKEFEKDNNPVKEWLLSNVEIAEGIHSKITDLFDDFKSWCNDREISHNFNEGNDFVEELKRYNIVVNPQIRCKYDGGRSTVTTSGTRGAMDRKLKDRSIIEEIVVPEIQHDDI